MVEGEDGEIEYQDVPGFVDIGRLFFDNFFNIILVIIMINMIAGKNKMW